ncbi:ribonuclease G [Alkalihalobacillus xiaoxiensis]|uniref:Ribonuclease G n=1 Tax=Shouchella xiaoxiensis TaxID=766895 RepID=A0ABS2SSV0_9BACI|nr:Rne/Rng family ribonuclease [Shouchella xiaoxiensis]MBM7838588.1 ribonuclease G [Shouchella xiaoxiensis]
MKQTIRMTKSPLKREAVVMENGDAVEWFIESDHIPKLVGSVFKGKVDKVLPGMQAAFINIGMDKNGFIHRDELLSYHLDRDETKEKKSITSYLSKGMELTVQVTKEGVGDKGPRLSGVVSIPGSHLVYMPEGNYVAISRRIASDEKRTELAKAIEPFLQGQEGVIVRTQAAEQDTAAISEELAFLRSLWFHTKQEEQSKPPFLLYQASSLMETLIKSYLMEPLQEWVVDDYNDFQLLRRLVGGKWIDRIRLYPHQGSSFEEINNQLEKAQKRRYWLKNGSFLVFDEAEAMTVIDVNSGKYTGKHNQAETAFTVNKQAVVDICKQIRLRNYSGIIIIDFIDMADDTARNRILSLMEKELTKDRIKTSIKGFTQLGLLEMTRKKTRHSIKQSLSTECSVCKGSGGALSIHAHAFELERLLLTYRDQSVVVKVTPELNHLMFDADNVQKERLEAWTGTTLYLQLDLKQRLCSHQPYQIVYAGSNEEAIIYTKRASEQD